MAIFTGVLLAIVYNASTEAIEEFARAIVNRVGGANASEYYFSPLVVPGFGTVAVEMSREISPP